MLDARGGLLVHHPADFPSRSLAFFPATACFTIVITFGPTAPGGRVLWLHYDRPQQSGLAAGGDTPSQRVSLMRLSAIARKGPELQAICLLIERQEIAALDPVRTSYAASYWAST
ncbi:hypothetical protein ACKWRH_09005 [Bradyrhizobium sp. Pa8]|uniref:hypothetical protein n=1 Tax=Bradyrhizobium sp. Pa8 TaxID=3386552 RepID=UPI00403F5A05